MQQEFLIRDCTLSNFEILRSEIICLE